MTKNSRIHSLDGLRALSITLVFAFHLSGTRGFWVRSEDDLPFDIGNFGVMVFFVISGFLISSLLFGELERYGGISLSRFYFRRTERIFPAYYAYLLLAWVGTHFFLQPISARSFLMAATYTSNYDRPPPQPLAHAWSLSVEEQFYLLWPALLTVLGRTRGLRAAFVFVLFAPAARVAMWRLGHYNSASFLAVGDSIAVGCLLAGYRDRFMTVPLYARLVNSTWFVLVPIALVIDLWARHIILLSLAAFQTIEIVLIALCLDWCLRQRDGVVFRLLNSRPLVYVGTLSYSLYLFQQPFLTPLGTTPLNAFPLNVAAAVVAGLACHYLVEKPCLALRERFEPPRPQTVKPEGASG
jgi:peptidoglycan/LPS O-acetylase OafA/YrhL